MTPPIPHAVQIAIRDRGLDFTVIDRVARALAREGLIEAAGSGWVTSRGVTFETASARAAQLARAPSHHDCPTCGFSHPIAGG